MNRKKRTLAIVTVLLVLLIGLPCWLIYHQVEQEHKDQALIEAIKTGDDRKVLELLYEGANGEARDTPPPTFREALRQMLDHIRHPDTSNDPADDKRHLPALLLLYQERCNPQPDILQLQAGILPHYQHPALLDREIVQAFLDHGALAIDQDAYGRTPLWYAAHYSNGEIVSLLLARGASAKQDVRGKDGWNLVSDQNWLTPVACATGYKKPDALRILLEHSANIEARDVERRTPLMLATTPNVIYILLDHGANIEARDAADETPLIHAVENEEPEVVRILLEHGAKVTAKDWTGCTALHYAWENVRYDGTPDSRKIATLLRKYGAK